MLRPAAVGDSRGRLAAMLGITAVAVAGCSSGSVFSTNRDVRIHTVVLAATAPEDLEVKYLDARQHDIDVPDAGRSWTLSASSPSGRWVSFVAYPATTGGIEEVRTPHCSITVDGRQVARSTGDVDTTSCSLTGWIGSKPRRKSLPVWVTDATITLSLIAWFAILYRARRLSMWV